ncbi:MAG TPA: hypothetical protein VGG09_09195 [Acidimicrobiales bacterium]
MPVGFLPWRDVVGAVVTPRLGVLASATVVVLAAVVCGAATIAVNVDGAGGPTVTAAVSTGALTSAAVEAVVAAVRPALVTPKRELVGTSAGVGDVASSLEPDPAAGPTAKSCVMMGPPPKASTTVIAPAITTPLVTFRVWVSHLLRRRRVITVAPLRSDRSSPSPSRSS